MQTNPEYLSPGQGREAQRFSVVGQLVDVLTMPLMLARLDQWIAGREARYACVADVNSIMRARFDPLHAAALRNADAVLPDGTPLVAVGRLKGFPVSRVCGPDFMLEVCGTPAAAHYRHFFYGSTPPVLEALLRNLQDSFPGLTVAGQLSPERWDMGPRDWSGDLETIKAASPDIVWIGLGCPKQERWMAQNVDALPGTVLIGVGAAFDFHAGTVKRAPVWMRRAGLEWAHRLFSEPRRLWRRYLLTAPQFVALAVADVLGHRLRGQPGSAGSNP